MKKTRAENPFKNQYSEEELLWLREDKKNAKKLKAEQKKATEEKEENNKKPKFSTKTKQKPGSSKAKVRVTMNMVEKNGQRLYQEGSIEMKPKISVKREEKEIVSVGYKKEKKEKKAQQEPKKVYHAKIKREKPAEKEKTKQIRLKREGRLKEIEMLNALKAKQSKERKELKLERALYSIIAENEQFKEKYKNKKEYDPKEDREICKIKGLESTTRLWRRTEMKISKTRPSALKNRAKVRIQRVMSEPSKIFVKEYETNGFQMKNLYRKNKNAKFIKTVRHLLVQPSKEITGIEPEIKSAA